MHHQCLHHENKGYNWPFRSIWHLLVFQSAIKLSIKSLSNALFPTPILQCDQVCSLFDTHGFAWTFCEQLSTPATVTKRLPFHSLRTILFSLQFHPLGLNIPGNVFDNGIADQKKLNQKSYFQAFSDTSLFQSCIFYQHYLSACKISPKRPKG